MKTNSKSGFTLIELMIVVAIIGVLAAIAIPQFAKFTAKSRRAEGIMLLKGFYTTELAYFAANDAYTHEGGTFNGLPPNLGFAPAGTPKFYNLTGQSIPFTTPILTGDGLLGNADNQSFGALLQGQLDSDGTTDQLWVGTLVIDGYYENPGEIVVVPGNDDVQM